MPENQGQQKGLRAGVRRCQSPGPNTGPPGVFYLLSFSLPYFLSSFFSFFLCNSLTNAAITMTGEMILSEMCSLIHITLEIGILTHSLEK